MRPAAHFGVNKGACIARANAGNMRVMIYQTFGINVFESAFDQVEAFEFKPSFNCSGLWLEGAADEMVSTWSGRLVQQRQTRNGISRAVARQ